MLCTWFRSSSVVLLALLLGACGSPRGAVGPDQKETENHPRPPDDLLETPTPEPTAVGSPLGDPVRRLIGPEGGSLSMEGGPTIDVPPGVLDEEIEFSIQPISNEAPHGHGRAYRLRPEGMTFNLPLTISLPLPSGMAGSGNEQGVGVAYQDDEGYWRAVDAVRVADGSVAADVRHFSDWTAFQQLELRPGNPSIPLRQNLGLWVYQCVETVLPGEIELRLLPTCTAATAEGKWAVNGVAGGDGGSGTVQRILYGAVYTAPQKRPSRNPVAVTVEVPMSKGRKALLVSNVLVVDGCDMERDIFECTWRGSVHYEFPDASISYSGTVTWHVVGTGFEQDVYVLGAEGSLRFEHTDSTCRWDPSEKTFHPDDGDFHLDNTLSVYLDLSTDPPTYWSEYALLTPFSTICHGQDQYVDFVPWLVGFELNHATDGGATLSGMMEGDGDRLLWTYTRL